MMSLTAVCVTGDFFSPLDILKKSMLSDYYSVWSAGAQLCSHRSLSDEGNQEDQGF
jgi:hypothetical protein